MDIEPQLKSLGHQALQDLYNNLVNAKAFALEHAPDVCQQIIAWQITKGAVVLCMAVALVTTTIWMVRRVRRSVNANEEWEAWGIMAIVLGFASLIVSVGAFIEGMGAVKAIVAPKLFLVEYIASIIK